MQDRDEQVESIPGGFARPLLRKIIRPPQAATRRAQPCQSADRAYTGSGHTVLPHGRHPPGNGQSRNRNNSRKSTRFAMDTQRHHRFPPHGVPHPGMCTSHTGAENFRHGKRPRHHPAQCHHAHRQIRYHRHRFNSRPVRRHAASQAPARQTGRIVRTVGLQPADTVDIAPVGYAGCGKRYGLHRSKAVSHPQEPGF